MTNDDYRSNRQKVAEAIAIISRASADADAAAHQPGKNDARFSSDVWQKEFTLQTGLELSRAEVQSLLTTDDSDPVTGNQKKKPEIFWHPEWMLHEAAKLGQVVERLDAREEGRAVCDDRSPIAVPVLLALSIELALKALQWNERGGRQPAHTHDLLVLFKGLKKDTRERIEANMAEVPGILPELPRRPGIRTALSRARNAFIDWRYPYEHRGLIVETAELKTALNAILDVHPVQVVRGPTLGNQRRRQ
ncbi:MAG: hypothetical protein OXF33_06960 [Rhodospirillales bacterium]|nr:hypothetical protein [Rhodospirillales bacterium]